LTQEQTAVEIAAASIAPGQPLTLEQQQIPWRLRQAAVQQHPAHQAQHLSMGPDGGGGGRGRRHRGNPNGGGMDMGRVRRRPSPSPARPGPRLTPPRVAQGGPPTRWPSNEPEEDMPQLRAGPDDAFRLDRPRGARMTEKWQKRWHSGGWAGRPYMIGAKPGGQYKSGGEFAQVSHPRIAA